MRVQQALQEILFLQCRVTFHFSPMSAFSFCKYSSIYEEFEEFANLYTSFILEKLIVN